ncbi:helix-turn-helix domain-containing protein [Desulforhopalus singaporensis]|nr:helix-turn-helix transcriptional regulator [Desulforhopalus singaporensis]
MSPPLQQYLKAHRKKAGFSQNDVAFLLGKKSGSHVSRFEQSKTIPDLCTSLSYQILFNVPLDTLFAGVNNEVEINVFRRTAQLISWLEQKGRSPKIMRRIDYLEEVARRIAVTNLEV